MDQPSTYRTSNNFNVGLKPVLEQHKKQMKRIYRFNRRIIKSGVQVLQSNVAPSMSPRSRRDQTFDSNASSVPTSSFQQTMSDRMVQRFKSSEKRKI